MKYVIALYDYGTESTKYLSLVNGTNIDNSQHVLACRNPFNGSVFNNELQYSEIYNKIINTKVDGFNVSQMFRMYFNQ